MLHSKAHHFLYKVTGKSRIFCTHIGSWTITGLFSACLETERSLKSQDRVQLILSKPPLSHEDAKCQAQRSKVNCSRSHRACYHHHTPTSHIQMPGLSGSFSALRQVSASVHPGRRRRMAEVLGSLHPNGTSRMNSQFLVLAWSSFGYCKCLGSEAVVPSSCHSAFQINNCCW